MTHVNDKLSWIPFSLILWLPSSSLTTGDRPNDRDVDIDGTIRPKVFTTIASCIRKAFEKSYGRGWNVVVGRSFGAYVTHEIKTYMYFTVVPGVYVLLWRWVVRRDSLVSRWVSPHHTDHDVAILSQALF